VKMNNCDNCDFPIDSCDVISEADFIFCSGDCRGEFYQSILHENEVLMKQKKRVTEVTKPTKESRDG
jgi:hypothetical protein